ncbi:NAD-dependent epimerase/dehydratase family protein [Dysosmobacter sp.]|uniref:NAD-dependent epimerase/dehydratase family protein n=1 Tax=Dysosmobacter sp. TaxID=2591382 RepID=UPI003AF18FEE
MDTKAILVLGGAYFTGRIFTIMATGAGHAVTLLNRGKYSMEHYGTKQELHFDRHDISAIERMEPAIYDAVVDFCGYEPGDVRTFIEHFPGRIGQYIFLSTADVYDRSIRTAKDENAPLMESTYSCPGGPYMMKKAQLDNEVRLVCAAHGIPYTILRPAFIYGPYNYAPRESYYIRKILRGEPIPVPVDSDSEFQFVYVKDVGTAILRSLEREAAYNEAFNLCAPEVITYPAYMEMLRQVSDRPFDTYSVRVDTVIAQNIPLPFPLRASENELFLGEKASRLLGIKYTDFKNGMELAYRGFSALYTSEP